MQVRAGVLHPLSGIRKPCLVQDEGVCLRAKGAPFLSGLLGFQLRTAEEWSGLETPRHSAGQAPEKTEWPLPYPVKVFPKP